MKKSVIVGIVVVGLILFAAIGSAGNLPQSSSSNTTPLINPSSSSKAVEKVTPTCDGTIVTKDCVMDGINYSTYVYYPAVVEKSHNETITTYEEKVTSYCTLCNDGTFSPSCATGRGACSHHGGVAQWNAPRYSSVPVYSTKKVVDTAAKEEYYEKVVQ